ncbi:RNA polymerase sigma factor [Niabella beijingensis]|uniref:RNA polymerase sigma factor n=1 Tax=Niabella beijingensis TaxID=2872700 RepID=UPI001CBE579B|nr:RNA polymerase sigma factor [Niabella beijingensis]MBZ4188824.1 RNA polymerase sigma factor [Niabella beijingensis]
MEISWTGIEVGDKDAYSDAYRQLYERFYNYGVKLVKDDGLVEDAIQEVLLLLWVNREGLRLIKNPDGYYYVLFRRALGKRVEALTKTKTIDGTEFDPEFPADVVIIKQETDQALREKLITAINTLSSRQREALFLRFYEGFSYEETAAVLGISVKATYKLMARSLLALRERVSVPLVYIFFLLKENFNEWMG